MIKLFWKALHPTIKPKSVNKQSSTLKCHLEGFQVVTQAVALVMIKINFISAVVEDENCMHRVTDEWKKRKMLKNVSDFCS